MHFFHFIYSPPIFCGQRGLNKLPDKWSFHLSEVTCPQKPHQATTVMLLAQYLNYYKPLQC